MSWTEKFTEMIFSLNRNNVNIEGAFMLKDQHLPKSIFKYREVNENSIKNLEEDTVWLADPSNFNDPYDCALTVDFNNIQKQKGSEFLERFLSSKGSDINLSDEQREKLILSSDPVNELIDILLVSEPPQKREGMKATLESAMNKMYEDLTLSNSKNVASSFKLCSFSERNDSMLMWAHYAYYHQGFCIEYDLENIQYSDYRRRFLYPTLYSDEMFDATEHLKNGLEDENFNNLHLSLAALIKAKDWEYEREWRLVFGNEIFAKEKAFAIGKPKSVYLGTKIKPENQERLVEICTRRDILLYKMKAHHREFKLEPSTIKDAEQHFFKEKSPNKALQSDR